jgi:Xaa-Pro aminopeptidase
MEALDCDSFFSISPPTNQYLSGLLTAFYETSSAIVVTQDEAHFLCDFRYTEQANEEVTGFTITEISGDQLIRGAEKLNDLGAKQTLFDPNGISFAEHQRWTKTLSGDTTPHATIADELRLVKTVDEIELIRAASELAEGVLTDIVPQLKTGAIEKEVAAQFEFEFKKRGATASSFDTIALFGAKSSLPHGEPAQKTLAPGDIMLFDFGCRLNGYCSDMTRTYVFEKSPGAWFDEIYNVTLEAQLASLEAVKPGAIGQEVDGIARTIISDAGYGEYFGHGLGHGVGIEIHENPRLNKESKTVLEPGMIVTVEPGIYLPGKGGVRIEDLVVVTETRCDILTKESKDFTIISN